jgi:hypothetical protein
MTDNGFYVIYAPLTAMSDDRVLALFSRNLTMIATICRAQHVQAVFVPQAFNCRALTSARPYGWLPFVRDRDLCAVGAGFSAALTAVGKSEDVPVITAASDANAFHATDFLDQGHFSAKGGNRFAAYLATALRERSLLSTRR